MVTKVPQLFKRSRGQVFFLLNLFYIRLLSNVTVISNICLNQAHVLKAQIKCGQLPLFAQNQQQIFLLIIISR